MAQIVPIIKQRINELCRQRGFVPKGYFYAKELSKGFWGLISIRYISFHTARKIDVSLGIFNDAIAGMNNAVFEHSSESNERFWLIMSNIGWLDRDKPQRKVWLIDNISDTTEVCNSIFCSIDNIAYDFFDKYSNIDELIHVYENISTQPWPILNDNAVRVLPLLYLSKDKKSKGLNFLLQYYSGFEVCSENDINYVEKYDKLFGNPLLNEIRSGDIFSLITESGAKRYFQFVTKDTSEFDSDVIRIFKKVYPIDSSPSTAEIVDDDVECYMHTMVSWGLYLGLWTRSGNDDNIGKLDISFRRSNDYGRFPLFEKRVSNNWEVWTMNQPKQSVGMLPESHYSADIGDIGSPSTVLKRINEGYFPSEWYPLYREQQ